MINLLYIGILLYRDILGILPYIDILGKESKTVASGSLVGTERSHSHFYPLSPKLMNVSQGRIIFHANLQHILTTT